VHHLQLKIRQAVDADYFVVDSPGMIDSPTNDVDRGYDFPGVVRWWATQADLVLVFFDPDKPGTTGETMSVLLQSLQGMDHKLLIVLNKADQFVRLTDFARAYGSLCWNLSKIIPRKDLPMIYTTCLPNQSDNNEKGLLLADLHTARQAVVDQVQRVPLRRLDNRLTQLEQFCRELLMHLQMLQALQQASWRQYASCTSVTVSVAAVSGGGAYLVDPLYLGGSLIITAATHWYQSTRYQAWYQEETRDLSRIFGRVYASAIDSADESTAAIWQRIQPSLLRQVQDYSSPWQLPRVAASDLQHVDKILTDQLPTLRRIIAPPSGKDDVSRVKGKNRESK